MSSEEANARALLLEMQTRLAEGPHTALGLSPDATGQEIRSAFLQLTKTFHPARFGRLTSDIQRLSNEVFLSLRAAHDALAKPRSTGRPNSTTDIPTTTRTKTRPFGVPTPATRPGAPPNTESTPPTRTGQAPPMRTGQSPPPVLRQSSPSVATPPARPSSPTPGIPMRPTPPARQPPSTPPTGIPIRPTPPPARQSPSTPPTGITFSSTRSGPTPGAQVVQNSKPASSPTLDRELAPILELMGMGMWDVAQAAIDALVGKNPQNKRYAAVAYYARGRRAQLEGDRRIAQIEFNEALKLDPDLEPAKIANAELFARRK